MVKGSSPVVVPGADFLLRGHYATDARGRPSLPDCRQKLEGNYEKYSQRSQGIFVYKLI
jgi:hypothetical protein